MSYEILFTLILGPYAVVGCIVVLAIIKDNNCREKIDLLNFTTLFILGFIVIIWPLFLVLYFYLKDCIPGNGSNNNENCEEQTTSPFTRSKKFNAVNPPPPPQENDSEKR